MFSKALINLEKLNCYLKIIVYTTFPVIFSSCVSQRDVEYLQDRSNNITNFDEAEFPDYKLKSNDELYIQVNSLDEGAANIFSNANSQASASTGAISPYGASLMSYSVDKEGYLLLPVIGNVFVKDKTLSQVSLILRDSLNHILNQPVVSVKLVNRYVSVLGEINTPGHFSYAQEKLSIYDALSLGGDITDYGNRKQVMLIRNEAGQNICVNLDLTNPDILASGYYYLRPNDIVYVKPLRKRFWGMREFPFAILFSTITTGLLIYNIAR